jgi:hypothetical protein
MEQTRMLVVRKAVQTFKEDPSTVPGKVFGGGSYNCMFRKRIIQRFF